jgi:hypothetical protein
MDRGVQADVVQLDGDDGPVLRGAFPSVLLRPSAAILDSVGKPVGLAEEENDLVGNVRRELPQVDRLPLREVPLLLGKQLGQLLGLPMATEAPDRQRRFAQPGRFDGGEIEAGVESA